MHMKRKHKKRKNADLPVLAGCTHYSYMNPMAAINYLSINGFLLGPSIKEESLAAEAQKLAGAWTAPSLPISGSSSLPVKRTERLAAAGP